MYGYTGVPLSIATIYSSDHFILRVNPYLSYHTGVLTRISFCNAYPKSSGYAMYVIKKKVYGQKEDVVVPFVALSRTMLYCLRQVA